MSTRMQQRRGTAQQWTDANPVLAEGEVGFETDTYQFKIGNGVNAWASLDYFSAGVDLSAYATETYVDTAVANILDAAPETLDTLNELAAALGDDPNFATTVTNSIAAKQDDVITTQGDLVIGDASGNPIRLAVGSADQVLTSDGTTVSFQDAGGGGLYSNLITSGVATSSFTLTSINQGYRDIKLVFKEIDLNGSSLRIRVNNNTTSNYYGFEAYSATTSVRNLATTYWEANGAFQFPYGYAVWDFLDYSNTSSRKLANWSWQDGNARVGRGGGVYREQEAITSITVLNVNRVVYELYGVN